jgi:hypothetical protein
MERENCCASERAQGEWARLSNKRVPYGFVPMIPADGRSQRHRKVSCEKTCSARLRWK